MEEMNSQLEIFVHQPIMPMIVLIKSVLTMAATFKEETED
jgi:hypothetical protein